MSAAVPATQRVAYLSALFGLLLLGLLGCNRGLWTPDEPREAEISREMALSPAVIPTLNGQRFIEKPPLYYWLVAAVYRLTGGPSVLAARSVSVGAGLATLALLLHWGSRAHSRSAGLISTCMLATSLQFVVSTHWVLIDPLLMLSTTVAAWAAWELLARGDSARLRLALYLALMLALWIKGLIGPVLIGVGLLVYIGIDRPAQWRRLRPLLRPLPLPAQLRRMPSHPLQTPLHLQRLPSPSLRPLPRPLPLPAQLRRMPSHPLQPLLHLRGRLSHPTRTPPSPRMSARLPRVPAYLLHITGDDQKPLLRPPLHPLRLPTRPRRLSAHPLQPPLHPPPLPAHPRTLSAHPLQPPLHPPPLPRAGPFGSGLRLPCWLSSLAHCSHSSAGGEKRRVWSERAPQIFLLPAK